MAVTPRPFTVLCCVALALAPVAAGAQDLGGTWRAGGENVSVSVAEWGPTCGPRPVSRAGAGGHEVTVRDDGSNLTLQGSRTNRTDRCWSDNRAVALVSTSHPSPHRWVITCSTPDADALGERGTYTLEATSATHLRFRDETSYAWTMEGSHCRASSVLTREYDRVATVAATDPTPPTPTPPVPARPPEPHPDPVEPPAPRRCAHPGAAVAVAVSPGRRSVPAGTRVCYHARTVDAARCEVPGGDPVITVRALGGAPEATVESGCLSVPAGLSSGQYEVTATVGGLVGHTTLTVVTADAYRSLVAAQMADPDGGTDGPPHAVASGAQVGTATVTPGVPGGSPGVPWHWVLLAGAGVIALAAVGVFLQRRSPRKRPVYDDDPPPAPSRTGPYGATPSGQNIRPRHNAVRLPAVDRPPAAGTGTQPVEDGLPHTPVQPPAAVQVPTKVLPVPGAQPVAQSPVAAYPPVAVAPRPAEAPLAVSEGRQCPSCGARYGADMAFCPMEGTRLEAVVPAGGPLTLRAPAFTRAPVEALSPAPVAVLTCPRCALRVGDGSRFCPQDGTALVASRGVEPQGADGVCPACRRRYAPPTQFCGEDGTRLSPVGGS